MKKKWWHNKIAYQIYPKSFSDSNDDGIGDLRGIINKLDYIQSLGVDLIWISPIYKSPFVDQGYDISDYYAIAEEFGTMEDFDELLAEARKRNMQIIMDLVINHCSDQHEWFQKALADPYGEFADYFFFRPGKDGQPPSNYRSYFGGSAWEPIPGTDLYYLHAFAKEQPDLNWENPRVLDELYRMIRWWLDKGIAGFRIDAIINIKKDLRFPDFPADGPDGLAPFSQMVESVEGVGELLNELRKQTFEPYDAFTVGEVFNIREDQVEEFVGTEGYFSSMFDFTGEILTKGKRGWYDAPAFDFKLWRDLVLAKQHKNQGIAMLANIIENHDEPRGASKYLPDYARNAAGIKMLAAVSILLRGIPFLYQGQEIGMQNVERGSIAEFDDISTKDEYAKALQAGLSAAEALALCNARSRDHTRTPMQWNDEPYAGFSRVRPWLPVNPNYDWLNVQAQEADSGSVLHFYRHLLAFRKNAENIDLFTYGACRQRFEDEDRVFAFERSLGDRAVLVAGNFGRQEVELDVSTYAGNCLLTNQDVPPTMHEGKLLLKPQELIVVE